MLVISIEETELYDQASEEFINVKAQELRLEHSLISVSKWEGLYHKAFLSNREKTNEETIDYIKCMTITQNVDPIVYKCLSDKNIRDIKDYIDNPMSATKFSEDDNKRPSNDVTTSELIYYWMLECGIPLEWGEKQHLNKLIKLIRVCSTKRQPNKRMSNSDIYSRNAKLNAARRQSLKSRG